MLFVNIVIMVLCSVLLPIFPKSSGLVSSYSVSTTTEYGSFRDVRSDFEIIMYRTTKSPLRDTTRTMGLATEACQMVNGLTPKQRAVCAESPSLIPIILKGIEKGIIECRAIFRNRRWNCSSFETNIVFGKKKRPQLPGNKERSIIHALASAGVVHVVAQSCYAGNLTACGMCPGNGLSNTQFQWGICTTNMIESATISKRMLDARENSYTPLSALNLHNNEVGRETIYELTKNDCRCHGQSASCSVKTCWHNVPKFEKVAKKLAAKYDHALLAVESRKRSGLIKLVEADQPQKRLINRRTDKGAVGTSKDFDRITHLYYIQESPSYCDADTVRGSLGTRGRQCVPKGDKWETCEFLCCGRGYRTETEQVEVECNCTFKFCCYVECDICSQVEYTHYCL